MIKTETIQSDFDKLALLDAEGWNHNSHYHAYLLKQIPENCRDALEIGCGPGSFTRFLAQRVERVLALDLSPEMIKLAKQRSAECPNIDYQIADVAVWDFPKEAFDCIVSIATLHHLPFANSVKRMKSGLM